ncbi:MGH1-like glycoside hydrolase domain-containing protein [Lichenibacterium dinghuense]|uniref:MGH1-like glycoside hydrolase domain-containing protein n=1 Tax=Lichenibacterium dinghuense TaxID=2895977 RepID=UPI001F1ED0CB|nr:glucosidase [Lichenibacterium sp. 6Y81]
MDMTGVEDERLMGPDKRDWRLWGTYLPERQWGTVREDTSGGGQAWTSFPYEDSRRRAYRSGEDGLLGWCDGEARLCFSIALWNGRDDHLKERLFGLSNLEGNHGEDVKELYYYLDGTPSGSYARALYKYPQGPFPYAELVEENGRRGFGDPEYEIIDTTAFAEDRYFDIMVEYGKRSPEDMLICLTVRNRGPETADLALLPTLIFRNAWGRGGPHPGRRPEMWVESTSILARHDDLGLYRLSPLPGTAGVPEPVFTGNEDAGGDDAFAYTKDAFHRLIVGNDGGAVDPARRGTKAAFPFHLRIEPGMDHVLRLRFARDDQREPEPLDVRGFDACLIQRLEEADAFYASRIPAGAGIEEARVMRQAYAGLLWTKQVYIFDVKRWHDRHGDAASSRDAQSLNAGWRHVRAHDVISMPDKWEYPWFAAWDLAFHMIPMAEIDSDFAKSQLLLMLSERYMHPNGALAAYEFGFDDANPPVHALAIWRVFEADRETTGRPDIDFLERAFQRLLLNFTWWVNRKDASGKDLFGGGFMGLDNIGLFDRDQALPFGEALLQADATAWMGLYCSVMLTIAVELAQERPMYQEMGVKFFHHFILIVDAINTALGTGLWDEETGFFYDQIREEDRPPVPLKVHSVVGLLPLVASTILRSDQRDAVPDMVRQIEEGLDDHPEHRGHRGTAAEGEALFAGAPFVALVPRERLRRLLARMLDEGEFLSRFGLRSLSKRHADEPVALRA